MINDDTQYNHDIQELVKYIDTKTILDDSSVLLANPHDKRHDLTCDNKMTKIVFYKDLWVEPEEKNKKNWDIVFRILNNPNVDRNLFYIKGYEGTGKTTSLNMMLYKIKNEECRQNNRFYNRIGFDFNKSTATLNFLGNNIYDEVKDVHDKPEVLVKYYTLLLYGLNKIVTKILEALTGNEPEVYKRYNSKFFEQVKREQLIFTKFLEYLENYKRDKEVEISYETQNKVWEIVKECFLQKENINPQMIMGLIAILQISYAHYQNKEEKLTECNLYWTFDNIERFIDVGQDGIPVYVREIVEICNAINDFITFGYNIPEIRQIKIIFVIRHITASKIFYANAHAQIEPYELIIDSNFNVQKILDQRKSFWEKILSMVNSDGKNRIKRILSKTNIVRKLMEDVGYVKNTGFRDIIARMFNNDFRRIIVFLFKIFENNVNMTSYDTMNDNLECLYNKIADDARSSISKEILQVKRRTALNLVFNKIKEADSIFERLEVIGGQNGVGSSYTRQILTYLKNRSETGFPSISSFTTDLTKYLKSEKRNKYIKYNIKDNIQYE